ncbi:MAG: sulfatase-like hydrolase/transferase [Planctomycetota bacterium]
MTHRCFCLIATLIPTALIAADASSIERPNIILMMCDDLGWGDVGFNGGEIIQTPHLDEMAKNSLIFSRFYAQAPVCSPTRGSAVTGRHPYRYGIYFANTGHMKPQELTVAELLQAQNYATGHFGKWHLGTLTKTVKDANRGGPKNAKHFSPPQDNGFDVCFSTESKVPTYDPMIRPKDKKPGSAWDAVTDETETVEYGTYYWNESGEIVRDNLQGDDSRIIMDRAIPFIESSVRSDKPFFAIIWFHTPHLPVVAGGEYLDMYREHEVRVRNYYGCITAMDAQVGRLRSKLAELGASDDTMICFCSDNGPEGNESAPGSAGPFRGRKRSLYEGGIRVPGLIEWPSRIKPGKTDFAAVTSDYLPTIANIVGAELDGQRPIDGISLLPVFDGTLAERPSPIGFQSRDMVALSDNRFKLFGKKDQWELYDLIADPGESKNLLNDHPMVAKSMKQTVKAWQAACKNSDGGGDY